MGVCTKKDERLSGIWGVVKRCFCSCLSLFRSNKLNMHICKFNKKDTHLSNQHTNGFIVVIILWTSAITWVCNNEQSSSTKSNSLYKELEAHDNFKACDCRFSLSNSKCWKRYIKSYDSTLEHLVIVYSQNF